MIRFLPIKWIVSVIAILVLLPFAYLHNGGADLFASFSKSVGVAVIALLIINSLGLWRYTWRLFPSWFNRRICPDLQGTYKGTLTSSWEGGMEIPDVKLVIRQNLLYIKVKQISGESVSFSEIADLMHVDRNEGLFRLVYVYKNEPKDSVQDRSLPHFGVATLSVGMKNKRLCLDGRYFNDSRIRQTTGEMHFQRTSNNANF